MTGLARIEGSNVDPEITEGLAARVADPLWYLARQWQVGEFRGEDAASPVMVDVTVESYPVTEILPAPKDDRPRRPFTPGSGPLEPLVEGESAAESLTAWDHLQAGLRLLRRLGAVGLDLAAALHAVYPMAPRSLGPSGDDDPGRARLALLARRGFDPRRLLADYRRAGENFAALKVLADLGPGDRNRAVAALTLWHATEAGFSVAREPGAPSSWIDRRQEYAFGVGTGPLDAAGGGIVLRAPDHAGGRLDWHRFDLVSAPEKLPPGRVQEIRALVSPLRFAGQPAQRFWEIEEGPVYFGDLQGGAGDLHRSILAAYAAVAGDDWFVVPARVPRGHIARVRRMRVRDNFSDGWTDIPSTVQHDAARAGGRVWRFFEHRTTDASLEKQPPLLFVPPVIASAEIGPPVEEVHFRRDEMANLAWAVERRTERPSGRVIEAAYPPPSSPPAPQEDGDWAFRLATSVPDHWFPLVPVRTGRGGAEVVLRRGLVVDGDGGPPPRARGRLLTPGAVFVIDEAEVPEGGTEVTRAWRYARGADGSRHLWLGRRKVPSTGPMARSPLGFDTLSGWPPGKGPR